MVHACCPAKGGSASWKKNRGAPAVISAVVETLLVAESLHYYTRSSDFLLFPFRHFSLVVLRKRERERERPMPQRFRVGEGESRRYSTLVSVCYPFIWGLYNKIEGSDKVIYQRRELSEARMLPSYTPVVVLVQR